MKTTSTIILATVTAMYVSLLACGQQGSNEEASHDSEPDSSQQSSVEQGTTSQTSSQSQSTQAPSPGSLYIAINSSSPRILGGNETLSLTESSEDDSWQPGNPLYEVYNLIREYDDSIHNGVIDGSNMHKAMLEGSRSLEGGYSFCDEIETQKVRSPFDFGVAEATQLYNCAGNNLQDSGGNTYRTSAAVDNSQVDTMVAGTVAQTTVEPNHGTTMTVFQVEQNKDTGDITVAQAYLVDYPGENDYAVRSLIKSNTESKRFTLKMTKGPGGGPGSGLAISAHGDARGDGYYLLKVSSSGHSIEANESLFCLEADATVEDLKAMAPEGSHSVPEECAHLEDGMPIEDFAADGSSAPTGRGSFTGDGETGTDLTWQSQTSEE